MDQGVVTILILVFLWLGWISYYLYNLTTHYQRLIKGVKSEDTAKILDNIIEDLGKNKKDISVISENLDKLQLESRFYIQKVGLLRFNPFSDTGGDQSFVLSILNGKDTGIVLTSLHNRGLTSWYAKNVYEGKGLDHELSEEEKESIKKAVLLHQKKK